MSGVDDVPPKPPAPWVAAGIPRSTWYYRQKNPNTCQRDAKAPKPWETAGTPRSTWHWRRKNPDARQIAAAPVVEPVVIKLAATVESEADRDARQRAACQRASERKRILADRLALIRKIAADRANTAGAGPLVVGPASVRAAVGAPEPIRQDC